MDNNHYSQTQQLSCAHKTIQKTNVPFTTARGGIKLIIAHCTGCWEINIKLPSQQYSHWRHTKLAITIQNCIIIIIIVITALGDKEQDRLENFALSIQKHLYILCEGFPLSPRHG